MVLAKKIILARNFNGAPQNDDFQIVEEELPTLRENGELIEHVELSQMV